MKDKMDKWVEKARTAIKWVAVDKVGDVYAYLNKPTCDGEYVWVGKHSICLGETHDKELIKNWDKSLRKVKYGK